MVTAVLLSVLTILAFLAYRELVKVRQQVSSIRQSIEWQAVGLLETSDNVSPGMREYLAKTKEDLIQEGLHEGTITEQLANEVRNRGR